MSAPLTLPAMALAGGDRFVVETPGRPPFDATVIAHHGWGLVHGVIEIDCRSGEERFIYGIGYDTLVVVKRHTHRNAVVETDGTGARDMTCGTCGRSWDNSMSSDLTPTPSGRCPFEYDHEEESDD